MNAKHTPGPHTCERDGRILRGTGTYLIWSKDEHTLAEIPIPIHGIPIPKDEAIANVRLFAAAPDLLAACEDMLRRFDAMEAQTGSPAADAVRTLKAAIAKATEATAAR